MIAFVYRQHGAIGESWPVGTTILVDDAATSSTNVGGWMAAKSMRSME